jgi:DNA (cytosine-5)-methyltransferase 1
MKLNYKWTMKDDYPTEKNGLKVFSCFACGGGSTMGYKLAGFEVLGCNEIKLQWLDKF